METIPNHKLDLFKSDQIIVEQLGHLGSYDFGIPHRHNYFELFYFQKGAGSHMIDFEDFKIESNSIHLVAPNQVHQVKRELDTNGFVVLFDLDSLKGRKEIDEFLFDYICYHSSELNPVFNRIDSSILTFLFDRIATAKEVGGTHSALEINQTFQLLLIECMKQLTTNKVGIDSDYVAFRKLLMLHFRKWHKVKEYALEIGITERTLNDCV
jgi:mannose-6-phosphate isomerase-like protein (cupin superfamily)